MDQIDYMILKQLQHNAKTSIKEIASQVHLSAPSVAERVKKLEEQGVIVGYQAKINLKKIECPIVALILFKSADCKSLASFCYTHPDVIECYRVAGEISYIAKIATSSVETLEAFIDQALPFGIPSTNIVLSAHENGVL
ncbi:Lrp/AsnC family transcriptional regulator [Mammaliicoccus sciuri]|uniref:Lrp/AsnC family transcriptional regulator n=1 Tax=Staphylococcaceae TaxID=90964 RepID=UPI000C334CC6|nr:MULTISPECIES: Lrp/AsnC family transcriptional regulator [Staphylococcaceae]MDW4320426.1 Lrp/AsnC family transcriptional regulator [Staphylococcus saprophyticus]HDH6132236.1 Lrp/AsnC family transcriptional regulator [Staphylococcus aureus]MCE4981408.1 Lrp/AsnC family transcriptional regulator [Mammaliicoccus sciuri]MCE5086313.1 Lrp/AsnC family transcriptional regulator [Mammaliicoccus sciuri]MCE5095801.1 Lrp/AsnC family transcriptional regulator [Mammaliicoccus sciuri]